MCDLYKAPFTRSDRSGLPVSFHCGPEQPLHAVLWSVGCQRRHVRWHPTRSAKIRRMAIRPHPSMQIGSDVIWWKQTCCPYSSDLSIGDSGAAQAPPRSVSREGLVIHQLRRSPPSVKGALERHLYFYNNFTENLRKRLIKVESG